MNTKFLILKTLIIFSTQAATMNDSGYFSLDSEAAKSRSHSFNDRNGSYMSKKSDDEDNTEVDSLDSPRLVRQLSPTNFENIQTKSYRFIANNIGYLNSLTGVYLASELTLDNYFPDLQLDWLPLTKTIIKTGLCALNVCFGTVLLYSKCKRVCFKKNQQNDDL